MLLADVASTSRALAATRSRIAKRALLADLLRRTPPPDVPVVAHYLAGSLRQRRTGLGWRSLATLPAAAAEPSLTVAEVDEAFARMATLEGAGSATERGALARALLSAATVDEQTFLRGLVAGEVRQGALDALLLDAIAEASGVPAELVRRAAMLTGETAAVAAAALGAGGSDDAARALGAIGLTVGRGIRPMLAPLRTSPRRSPHSRAASRGLRSGSPPRRRWTRSSTASGSRCTGGPPTARRTCAC